MALPPTDQDSFQPELYGIGVQLIPGVPPTFQIELQRAPDNGSGAPNVGAAVTIAQLPPVSGPTAYPDILPPDNAFRHYRWRHIGPGYDPSPRWTPWARGMPVRLEGQAGDGGRLSLYPLNSRETLAGATRSLLSVTTQFIPNAELDVWEYF